MPKGPKLQHGAVRPSIDQDEWKRLQDSLKRLGPGINREFNKEMRTVMRTVASDARRRAPKRSGKLREGIVPTVTQDQATVVSKARHSWITEMGGRHPLFGNRAHWFKQPARPYLYPALKAAQPEVESRTLTAIENAARAAGFTDQ